MPKRAPTDDKIQPVAAILAEQAASAAGVGEKRKQPVINKTSPAKQRPIPRPTSPANGALVVNRKVLISAEEADRNARVMEVINASFGSKANYSQVTRALWAILRGAEDAIRGSAKRAPRGLTLPSKGNPVALAEYEQELLQFLDLAIKRAEQ